jgi:hypothetical protein
MSLGRLRETDLLVWQHGPEHIQMEPAVYLLADLQRACPRAIVLEAPEGSYPQGELDNNPYEVHRSTWTAELFQRLGFQTALSPEGAFTIAVWRPE